MFQTKTVTLRKRIKKDGSYSLYLDYYPGVRDKETMKVRYHESLGIYIYGNPKNKREREYNARMMEKAEAIRCRRYEALINERFDFLDKEKLNGDFLAYFRKWTYKKNIKWQFVYAHFNKFVQGKCTFAEVDVKLCQDFRAYLLNAYQIKRTKMRISQNSAAGYFSTFRGLLRIAYRDKMIKENVNDYLDRIEILDTEKDYITLEELRILYHTPCDIPILRRAALFACMSGLRLSDIIALTWDKIITLPDGETGIKLRSQKTKVESFIPINGEALAICGERSEGKVFKGFKRSMAQHPLKKWLKSAGINKHITFHGFRHSYGCILHSLGVDIYTIKELLQHKNVTTTQIYVDTLDVDKRKATNLLHILQNKEINYSCPQ